MKEIIKFNDCFDVIEENRETGIIRVTPSASLSLEQVSDPETIISSAQNFLAGNKNVKKLEIDIDGCGFVSTIDATTTMDVASKLYSEAWANYCKQCEEIGAMERDERLKASEQQRIARQALLYRNTDEALLALTEIKPCDLSSGDTSTEEAVAFCEEVMTVFLKSADLYFSETKGKELRNILQLLGAKTTEKANKKFISRTKTTNKAYQDFIRQKDNIQFPLMIFDEIISKPGVIDFHTKDFLSCWYSGLDKQTLEQVNGNAVKEIEFSPIGIWLSTQNEKTKDLLAERNEK